MSAGLLATRMPAASSAAILSDALPEPPEMIAPAWPIRLPGGAVCPAMNAASGLVNLPGCLEVRGLLLGVAADLAHHQHGLGLRVGLEQRQGVDEARAVDRVAADADAGALADPQVRELPDGFIRQGARSAHDPDPPGLVDIARHDADLALAGRDDPGAVGADQPGVRAVRLQVGHGAGHVDHRDALGDRDDHRDAGVGGLHDRVGRERRRDEDHRRVGARLLHGLGDGVEDRDAERRRPAAAGRRPAHQVRPVRLALLGVERPRLARDALTDQPRVLVDQDAHEFPH